MFVKRYGIIVSVILFASAQQIFAACLPIDVVSSASGRGNMKVTGGSACEKTASINWTENHGDGSGYCKYGTTQNYGSQSNISGRSGTVNISGLTANTTYYYYMFISGGGSHVSNLSGKFKTSDTPVQPPVITSAASFSCTTGTTKTYTATATDPANKTVTFTFSGQPAWITSSGATLTLKPTATSQNATVKIVASNGTAEATINLAVTVVAASVQPPVITSAASVSCTTGTTKTYTATATDPANKTVTFTFSGQPAWITSSGATLELKPTTTSQNATVKIVASNGTVDATMNLSVNVVAASAVINNKASGRQLSLNIGKTQIYVPLRDEKAITVSLFSLDGALLMKRTVSVTNAKMDRAIHFGSQITGTYICKVYTRSGEISQKIVLQK